VNDANWGGKAEQDDEMAERVEEFAEALSAANDIVQASPKTPSAQSEIDGR